MVNRLLIDHRNINTKTGGYTMKHPRIITLSSALIVAATLFGASAEARKSDVDQCSASGLNKAECACVMALEKGTKKALRDYLSLYRNADTACNARASTEITKNSNDGEIDGSTSTTPPNTPPNTPPGRTKNNNGLGNGDEGGCQGGGCSDPDNPGHNDSGGSNGGNGGNGGKGGNKH
jgi:hypothetical protein